MQSTLISLNKSNTVVGYAKISYLPSPLQRQEMLLKEINILIIIIIILYLYFKEFLKITDSGISFNQTGHYLRRNEENWFLLIE